MSGVLHPAKGAETDWQVSPDTFAFEGCPDDFWGKSAGVLAGAGHYDTTSVLDNFDGDLVTLTGSMGEAGMPPSSELAQPLTNSGTSNSSERQTGRRSGATAEERLERQRERNRLAQIRYRARKKASNDVAMVQVAEVAASLDAARAEAAVLASQHSLLQQLLLVRDSHVGILHDAREAEASGPPELQYVPPCNFLEPNMTVGQMALLHGFCHMRYKLEGVVLSRQDAEAFANLGSEVVGERWRCIHATIGNIVGEMERTGADCPPLEAHLLRQLVEGRLLKWRVAHYMQGKLAEVGQVASVAGTPQWNGVLVQLQLDKVQARNLLAVARATRLKLNMVSSRREALIHELGRYQQAALGMPFQVQALSSLELRALTDKLEETVVAERDVYCRAAHTLFNNVFTLLQKAKAVTLSRAFGQADIAGMLTAWEETCELDLPQDGLSPASTTLGLTMLDEAYDHIHSGRHNIMGVAPLRGGVACHHS